MEKIDFRVCLGVEFCRGGFRRVKYIFHAYVIFLSLFFLNNKIINYFEAMFLIRFESNG